MSPETNQIKAVVLDLAGTLYRRAPYLVRRQRNWVTASLRKGPRYTIQAV